MEDEGLHYPPGAEPDNAAKEAEAAAQAAAEAKAAEEKSATEAAEKAKADEAAKAEADAKAQADADADAKAKAEADAKDPTKKRSIYDDYKDRKREAKEASELAASEKARADAAEARATELQALLEKKDDAKTPEERKEAKDDLEAFAENEGLKPDALKDLVGIIEKRLPKPEGGVLTPEEAAEWRTERARAKAAAEDQAILSEGSKVKEQLAISDDTELQTVMKEVVRLAHTKEFHDKEVDYIVWKNKDALSKLVSPKKPSFEEGGQRGAAAEETEVEFSGKITPGQAEKAMSSGTKRSYEIRRSA
jgi:hypothetical protein